jgi:hypothetical protein
MALALLRLDHVRARIEAQLPALAGNLGNAGDFAQLIERNQLPQYRHGGFVLPGRLAGGAARAMAGMFVQDLDETVSVVLVTRVQGDPSGGKALDEITPLVRAVIEAVCGWGPDDAPGVFTLVSGELVGSQGGALIFQLDFALSDQLRIPS